VAPVGDMPHISGYVMSIRPWHFITATLKHPFWYKKWWFKHKKWCVFWL